MGDMADWIIENGEMDELYEYGGTKSCRYCGKDELHWVNIGSDGNPVWRLADENNRFHLCKRSKK